MADASPSESRQFDFDTGGGTDYIEISGIVVPASGGGIVIGGIAETINVLGVGGGTAHDAADAGNPIKMGGRARTSAITAVANNDRVDAVFTPYGAMQVHLVDASGVSLSSGTQYVEDVALAANAATGTLVVARRDDALSTLTPASDDAVGLRVGDKGALWVQISDGSGNQITSFGGGTQYVGDAAATATPTGTMGMGLASAAAPTNVSAGNDAVASWHLLNGAQVINLSAAGALIGGDANGLYTQGHLAHDAVDAGNPLKIGGYASAATPTAVSDGDRTRAWFTTQGAMNVRLVDANGDPFTSANGASIVAVGATASGSALTSSPVTVGARASTALPSAVSPDGDVVNLWASQNGALNVILRDAAGAALPYVGDAAATSTPTGIMGMALANSAAPADVSANNDAVAPWALRNGSLVVNIASGGTLLTNTGQSAATANFGLITNGTLTAGVVDETGASAVDAFAVGGATPHDSVDSGNPIKIGGKAASSIPSAVAAADRVDAWFSLNGSLNTIPRDVSGNELFPTSALADATVNPTLARVGNFGFVYNGTTWDRAKSINGVITGGPTFATGVPAAGVGPGFARIPAGVAATGATTATVDARGASQVVFDVSGTFTGFAATIQVSYDGATYVTVNVNQAYVDGLGVSAFATAIAATATIGRVFVNTWGAQSVRLNITAVASGTASVQGTGNAFGSIPAATSAAGTQYVGDAAATSTPTGTMSMGLANSAAPTNVSANNDAVAAWYLLSGAQVTQLSAGGTLIGATAETTQVALAVGGGTAHDAVDVGSPLKIGGKANAAAPTSVAENDRANAWFLLNGAQATVLTAAGALIGGDATNGLDVDVTRTVGQFVGDAAATSTPTGIMGMALANAAAPADVSANNDAVAPWALRNGSLVVNLASGGTLLTVGAKTSAASFPVVLASDQATLPTQGTETLVDNAGFTDGTTRVGMAGYIFDDVAGTALTENDAAAARIDSKRAQVFVGEDATTRAQKWAISAAGALSGNLVQVGGTTVVTGGVAGTQGVAGIVAHDAANTNVNPLLMAGSASAAAPADTSADGDVTRLWTLRNGSPVVNIAAGGTLLTNIGQAAATSTFVRINDGTTTAGVIVATTALKTDLSSVAGTATVTGGVAGSQSVGGPTASDAAIAANPVTVGARASTAVPTAVSTDGDVVNVWANRNGAVVVLQAPHLGLNSDPWNLVHEGAQYTTTQTSTVFAAGGASEKIVVTQIQIQTFDTSAGDLIVYFGTGAFARGTNRAIFDGTFKPSSTQAPGVVMNGPFISGTNGDDIMVTTTNNLDVTISVWYYVVT